ncbi:MAG: zincin-like metallopeptidase domain-containing protein [Bacteriovoracales bacterium]|nr:zincin-like metallopeptidase domain-containing protein [Bacteriovoracales bacterium]
MNEKVFERVTNLIIEKMETGTVPWKRPWSGSTAKLGQHQNALSGKVYRGANAILAYLSGHDSPYWLTFNQAKERGGNIKKGEKGTTILYWHFPKEEEGKGNDEGKKKECLPFVRYYTVFNARQIEGIKCLEKKERQEEGEKGDALKFNANEKAEELIGRYRNAPEVCHKRQRAYYDRTLDLINMPRKESFKSVEEYYSTLFHELAHSTGHQNRLKRKSLLDIRTSGDHAYSKEELVAEISAAFLSSMAGIETKVIDNQTAYINGWLKKLKKDSKLFIHAAQCAQKAVDYITDNRPSV